MTTTPVSDVASLLDSWKLALKADHKSHQTIDSYTTGVRLFLRWCDDNEHTPALDRTLLRSWVADLIAGGAQPATARARQMAIKRFSAWLAEEGEIDLDELAGLKPPKLDTKVVERLTDEECAALVKTCSGKSFIDHRDDAIVRLMLETGLRAGEVLGLTVDDIDLARGSARVRRVKGGKGRVVPFGPQTARAIDRYIRTRRSHRLAHTGALWLGGEGQSLGYHGLRVSLARRAELAGIKQFHLHLLRHTAASRWLAAGGSDGGLMAVAGWSSREMLDRYTRSTAADRAAAEARGLGLGDF